MKKHLSKKRVVLAAIITVALALASCVAYAYWTTSGNGISNAATACTAGNLTVSVTVAGGIHPGLSVAVTGTIANPTSSSIHVSSVAFASIDTVTNCAAGDFHFATVAPTNGATTLAAGTGSVGYVGTLTMDDTGSPQDACQGQPLTLHLTAS